MTIKLSAHALVRSPSRRQFLAGASLLALLPSFAPGPALAAASGTKNGKPTLGGTLVIGQYQEPTFYDPNRQYSWETYRVDKHIYESLLAEDLSTPVEKGPPPLVPALAESYEISDDATTFTFHLRKGVKFHDGEPFDAEVLRFNVRRFTDKSFEFYDVRSAATMQAVYAGLKEFKILDPYTVQYIFSQPFREFPRLLPQGNYVSGIFSPRALKIYGQDGLAEHPTGTGPYKFVERIRNERTVLVRNGDYWGANGYLERLIFRPIPDDSTRLSALLSGEIDILTRTPTDAVASLEQGGFQVLESPTAGQLFLSWNFRNKFGGRQKVRQAVIHAIDRKGLVDNLFKDAAVPSYNILNIGNTAYDPEQRDYPYDPDRARKLLTEEGFKQDEVRFTIITDVANQPVIEWIQRDLAKVGIVVDIVSEDWLTYTGKLAKLAPETALFTMEWGFITPYWLKIVYDGYVVTRGGGGELVGPDLGPAIAAATTEPDEIKAIQLWKRANALLQQQAAVLPLTIFTRYFTTSPKVRGFNAPLQNFYDLTRVWLEA